MTLRIGLTVLVLTAILYACTTTTTPPSSIVEDVEAGGPDATSGDAAPDAPTDASTDEDVDAFVTDAGASDAEADAEIQPGAPCGMTCQPDVFPPTGPRLCPNPKHACRGTSPETATCQPKGVTTGELCCSYIDCTSSNGNGCERPAGGGMGRCTYGPG